MALAGALITNRVCRSPLDNELQDLSTATLYLETVRQTVSYFWTSAEPSREITLSIWAAPRPLVLLGRAICY